MKRLESLISAQKKGFKHQTDSQENNLASKHIQSRRFLESKKAFNAEIEML